MTNKEWHVSPYLKRPIRSFEEYTDEVLERLEHQEEMSACVKRMQTNLLNTLAKLAPPASRAD